MWGDEARPVASVVFAAVGGGLGWRRWRYARRGSAWEGRVRSTLGGRGHGLPLSNVVRVAICRRPCVREVVAWSGGLDEGCWCADVGRPWRSFALRRPVGGGGLGEWAARLPANV